MNLINNSSVIPGAGNQITGLVPGQNIFVNGQMLNIGQLGGLTVPQLQVQHNTQGGVTLANLNATVTHAAQFQPTTQQLVIQQNGQQHQFLLQPKNSPSPSHMANAITSQRFGSGLTKNTPTPTSSANSASSTPVPTPTPTPTPDLTSDSCDSGGKTSQGINILEQALALSAIDLQSFEDDFSFIDNADFPLMKTPPPSVTPIPLPVPKPKPQPAKSKSKTSKPKPKTIQPNVNMTVNNSTVPFQQPSAQLQNAQGQKVAVNPQQKIITTSGQVFVLSANGQQFILQPSATAASPVAPHFQAATSVASTAGSINRTNISIPSSSQLQDLNQRVVDQSAFNSRFSEEQKRSPHSINVSTQQKTTLAVGSAQANKVFIKASLDGTGTFKIETPVHPVPNAEIVFTTMASASSPQDTISQTSATLNQAQMLQIKNQKITTLSGTFFKQEPQETVTKQESVAESQPISNAQAVLNMMPSTMNLSHTSLAATTSNIIAVTAPLVVSSASFTATSTTTTQSHQVTIMSTTQMAGSWQTSTTDTYPSYSLALNDKQSSVCQPQGTATLVHSGSSTSTITTSAVSSSSKSVSI